MTGLDAPLGDLPEVEVLPFPEVPASSFSPWDGQSVMLYDVVEMTERNLGPGTFVAFSPSGTQLAWAARDAGRAQEVFVLEVPDGEPRSVGPGRTVRWLNEDEIVVHLPNQNVRQIVNVVTGERVPDLASTDPDIPGGTVEVGAFRLEHQAVDEYPYWRFTYRLTDLTDMLSPLEFEASEGALATDGGVFAIASPPDPSERIDPGMEIGLANVFEIDSEAGEATVIAATLATAPNTPLTASDRYVAWADNFCNLPEAGPSRTLVYDRETEELIAFDRAEWVVLTERGELGIGQFGPRALFDLDTLQYSVVIDPNGSDITWSPDYRFAARGFADGHGGRCG